jgi:hypothetical protein
VEGSLQRTTVEALSSSAVRETVMVWRWSGPLPVAEDPALLGRPWAGPVEARSAMRAQRVSG